MWKLFIIVAAIGSNAGDAPLYEGVGKTVYASQTACEAARMPESLGFWRRHDKAFGKDVKVGAMCGEVSRAGDKE